MKVINLNESQYNRLFESVTDSDFGTSTVPEYDGLDKVELQPTISDKNGAPKKSNPITTNKLAGQLTTQGGWGYLGGRNATKPV
jgi:hypothetical protein